MNILTKRILALILALFISVLAVIGHHKGVYTVVQQQTLQTLEDVANQSQLTIENELNDTMGLLRDLAATTETDYTSLESMRDIHIIIQKLRQFRGIYDFKRMGIIQTDGIAHTTDGYVADVSGMEAFRYGREGLPTITEAFQDSIGTPELIHVFSYPLFNKDGAFMGVIFATSPAQTFNQPLNVDSFDGQGCSYIVNDSGKIITRSSASTMGTADNLLEHLTTLNPNNLEAAHRLEEAMRNKESVFETFQAQGNHYLYCTPLNVDSIQHTWYLFTEVPAAILDEKVAPILQHQKNLLFIIATLMGMLFIFFLWSYRRDAKLLRSLAYEDPLTRGDNYAMFQKKLQKSNGRGYMVSLDLSEFKLLNSICGLPKGDLVLKAVWQVLCSHLSKDEPAAHVAADRYVMFMQAPDREALLERIKAITADITELSTGLNTIQLMPYYGIYETTNLNKPEECYTRSLQAKKLVKDNPVKNWAFYEDVDLVAQTENKQLIDHFEEAIENHEFEIWYQPKYDTESRHIVGAEALVRWRKSDGTLIPPFRFIPLFERNGMIVTLDEYVFSAVCRQIKEWEKQHKHPLPISINISRASLYYDYIVDRYTEILKEYDMKPSRIPLEVTESATINNQQIQDLVNRFREVGFPIYLDDFGNGYSSLATLNMLQFDTIKLDKSLVDFIGDTNGEKLLRYTIKLAKSLGMRITAEGVETENQVNFLHSLHCDEIQGYFFSKPLPLKEFSELI